MQRLIICLDGTWNKQDSSTNVLHHYNLIHEGVVPGQPSLLQQKLYLLGVGTGVLDSVSGGAFGIGLEANVRTAYNWLVGHYRPGDQIILFGFSRGAYTARSLAGFISQCGLLRRAAPVTVEQLWEKYCLLGRQKENRQSWWEWASGEKAEPIQPYLDIVHYGAANTHEQLLLQWSRRVPIHYLGLYDTVGAIGIDALAIPGLNSTLALHNNVRPTSLIRRCRHALAIDEHRGNFAHTPFEAFVTQDPDELRRSGLPQNATVADVRNLWAGRIEQRWFVGAHSNVGGGYPDNELARLPFRWVMSGAQLHREPLTGIPSGPTQAICDSYTEFGYGAWKNLLRNKPNYRCLLPKPERRANRAGVSPGYSVESIQETVDDSVLAYWRNSGRPIPPNFAFYLERNGQLAPGMVLLKHRWVDESGWSCVLLVLWSTAALYGVYAVQRIGGFYGGPLPLLWAGLGFVVPFLDWLESWQNFQYARKPDKRLPLLRPAADSAAARRAILDSLYWTRTVGLLLVCAGTVFGFCVAFACGIGGIWTELEQVRPVFLCAPFLTVATILCLAQDRVKACWSFAAIPLLLLGIALVSGTGSVIR